MANLKSNTEWSDVYQLEKNDPALAGPGGVMNRQAQSLLNRTEYLKTNKADNAALVAEVKRSKSVEENLQRQITTSTAGIKYFNTLAQLNAFTPGETDPHQAYVFETQKNYLWENSEWKDEGKSVLDQSKDFTKNKVEKLTEQFVNPNWSYSRLDLKDTNFTAVSGLMGFSFGGIFSKNFNTLHTYLHIKDGTSKIILKCYSRNKDTLDDIPETPNDILQFTIEKQISDFGVNNGWVLARFDFNNILDSSNPILFVISAVDSNNNAIEIGFSTCSSLPASEFTSGAELGYYKSAQYGWSVLTTAVSYKIGFEKTIDKIELDKQTQTIVSTADKSFTFGADYSAWVVGFPTITSYFNAIKSEIRIKAGTQKVVCQVIARQLSNASSTSDLLEIATDKIIGFIEQSVDTSFFGDKTFTFEFDPTLIPENYFVAVKFLAFSANNMVQNLGMTVQTNSGSTYPIQSGAYRSGSDTTWLLASNAWKVGATLIHAKKVELNTEIKNINLQFTEISQSLDSINLTNCTVYEPVLTSSFNALIANITGSLNIFTQIKEIVASTSHDAAATGSTTIPTTLKKVTAFSYWVNNPNQFLGYHWLTDVVVTRTDTHAVLIEGADYEVDYFGGKLYSYNLDNLAVSVSFKYKKERYDLIQYNLVTNTVTVKKGTERTFDAQEYMPFPTSGQKGLFTVLVVGNEIKGIQPIYKTKSIGGDFYKMPIELATIKSHNSKCLRKVRSKIEKSQEIKLLGWGDSITAINGGTDTNNSNGKRDLISYPMTNLPRETVILYSDVWNDSDGEHVKIGWNWYLKSFIESNYGSAVTYLNYGLSGMGSGQGVDPVNISNINANNADLIVMCWGMNDQLSIDTYPNLISIIKQLKANGSDVVIMPVPRTPKINNITPIHGTETDYNTNLLRCYQAAIEADAAFVPAHLYVGYNNDNSIGLYPYHYCSANLVNHPGLFELKMYGKILCSLFE